MSGPRHLNCRALPLSRVSNSAELQALASALRVNNVVTEINLAGNHIGDAGAEA